MNRAIVREVARDPGFDITVAAPSWFHGDLRPVDLSPESEGSPLRIVGLPARWSRNIHLFHYRRAELRQLLRDGKFDVVHAWEEPYIFAGYQIARELRGLPSRFCFRTAQNLVKRYPPPSAFFERGVLKRAQGWIAGGQLVHHAMLQRGYRPERGRIISLAVDLQLFRPLDQAEKRAVREELELQGPVIAFVGRFTAEKGIDVLMSALEQLPPGMKWSLLLLGSGPYAPRIRRWAAHRGWSDRVRIVLAKHDAMPRYFGVADVLVAPSQTTWHWREQFGRMLIEAFASGVPVIGSDSGEIPLVIGDAGRIVPERDAAGYARSIVELLRDEALRTELIARGLERAERYSVAAVASQYREYYRWLATQQGT